MCVCVCVCAARPASARRRFFSSDAARLEEESKEESLWDCAVLQQAAACVGVYGHAIFPRFSCCFRRGGCTAATVGLRESQLACAVSYAARGVWCVVHG